MAVVQRCLGGWGIVLPPPPYQYQDLVRLDLLPQRPLLKKLLEAKSHNVIMSSSSSSSSAPAPKTTAQARRWCFTINNPTPEDELALEADVFRYLIYGEEVGESGTPHLQCYAEFPKPTRLSALKKMFPRAHFEVARGSPQEASAYCKKDGKFTERGVLGGSPGNRADLEAFKTSVKAGTRTYSDLLEEHSDVCAKYPRFVKEYLQSTAPAIECPDITLREWQSTLIELLKQDPHPRGIHFIVDKEGGHGKTTFAKYLMAIFKDVQYMDPGKLSDMAYELRDTTRILIMDCPRSRSEQLQYHFLEKVKDGLVFSGKYESITKRLKPCHVLCFMNQWPDMEALSRDRYFVMEL